MRECAVRARSSRRAGTGLGGQGSSRARARLQPPFNALPLTSALAPLVHPSALFSRRSLLSPLSSLAAPLLAVPSASAVRTVDRRLGVRPRRQRPQPVVELLRPHAVRLASSSASDSQATRGRPYSRRGGWSSSGMKRLRARAAAAAGGGAALRPERRRRWRRRGPRARQADHDMDGHG